MPALANFYVRWPKIACVMTEPIKSQAMEIENYGRPKTERSITARHVVD